MLGNLEVLTAVAHELSWEGHLEGVGIGDAIICNVVAVNSQGVGSLAHAGPVFIAKPELLNPSIRFSEMDSIGLSKMEAHPKWASVIAAQVRFTSSAEASRPEKLMLLFRGWEVSNASLDGAVELVVPGVGIIEERYALSADSSGTLVLDRWNSGLTTWFHFIPRGTEFRIRVTGLLAPQSAQDIACAIHILSAFGDRNDTLESVEVQIENGLLFGKEEARQYSSWLAPNGLVDNEPILQAVVGAARRLLQTPFPTVTCSGPCSCPATSASASGTFSDGPGEYGNNVTCRWLVSSAAGQEVMPEVSISFPAFDTESGYDYVYINECQDSSCGSLTQIAQLDGNSVDPSTAYVSSTGHLQVVFSTDGKVTRSGFEAEWRVLSCLPNSYRNSETYLGVAVDECMPCGDNASSPAGSVSPFNCSCDAGYETLAKLTWQNPIATICGTSCDDLCAQTCARKGGNSTFDFVTCYFYQCRCQSSLEENATVSTSKEKATKNTGNITCNDTCLESCMHSDGRSERNFSRCYYACNHKLTCQQCLPGTYSSAGSVGCIECSAGYYSRSVAASTCASCPNNSYSEAGSSICTCNTGYVGDGDFPGHPPCERCPGGICACEDGWHREMVYGNDTNHSVCLECKAGTFSKGNSSTACLRCPPGTFTATDGSSECLSCQNGKYANSSGATACDECSVVCAERRVVKEECKAAADTVCVPCCLTASWSLNGDTADASLNEYHLQNSGLSFHHSSVGDPWGVSPFNMSMYARFDSTGENFARLGPGFNMNMGPADDQQLTIEVWIRTIDTLYAIFHYNLVGGNDLAIMGGESGASEAPCLIYADSGAVYGPPGEICASIRDNQWYHLTITLKDRYFTFYLNGVNMGTNLQALRYPLQFGPTGFFVLGQDADNGGTAGWYDTDQAFVGDMADFRMWNVSKTQAEIVDLMYVRLPHVFCEAGFAGVMEAWGAACQKCPVGTYKKANGTDICHDCPPFSNTNNTMAQLFCKCLPGYENHQEKALDRNQLDECVPCPAGKYKSHLGSEPCTDCTPNSYSPVQSDEALDCICNKGYEGNGSSACLACPSGKYKDWEGPRAQPLPCTPCPRYSTTTSNATNILDCTCLPGYTGPYGPPESVESRFFFDLECTACEPGTYKNASGSAPCLECPQNAYSETSASTFCACNAGYAGTLYNCTSCASGKYKDILGTEACSSCPADSYSDISGATVCTECPPGSLAAAGSSLRGECIGKPGFYGPDGGPFSACEEGTYKSEAGSTECIDCKPYAISPKGSTTESTCQCRAGYTSLTMNGPCIACAAGKYKAINGSAACLTCPSHADSPPASYTRDMCICKEGYTGQNGQACSPCESGTYKASNGSASCAPCPNNTHSPEASSHITKCVCKPGYTGDDSFDCTACEAGKYKTASGSGNCILCQHGSQSSEASTQQADCECMPGWQPSGISCTPCSRGYYKSNAGSESCLPCPSGTFMNRTGSWVCEVCPADSNAAQGKVECTCNAGFYGLPQGSQSGGTEGLTDLTTGEDRGCMPCGVGSYKPTEGSQSCFDCQIGKYSRNSGAAACEICPDNPTNAHDETLLLQCLEDFKFACETEHQPFACFLTQYMTLSASIASCTGFGGALVRVSSSLPTAPDANSNAHAHNEFTLDHMHSVDRSWGSLLEYGLLLTQADEGFYWPGAQASIETEDELQREWCAIVSWSHNKTNSSINRHGTVNWWEPVEPYNRHSPYASPANDEILIPRGRLSAGPEGGLRNFTSRCEGVKQRSVCIVCAEGHFLNTSTQHCQACGCQAGAQMTSACGRLSDGCTPCPPGSYSLQTQNCSSCPAGKYLAAAGKSRCLDCVPGYGSIEGSTVCFQCQKGFASRGNGSTCERCPRGTWSQPGDSACSLCQPGFTTGDILVPTSYGVSLAIADSCPRGCGPKDCRACPAGSYSDDARSGCTACLPGYISATAASSCLACGPGFINPETGATVCQACAAGMTSEPSHAGLACVDCPAGKYSIGGAACSDCGIGSFSNHSASTFCFKCGPGYSSSIRGTSCYVCPAGTSSGPLRGSECRACGAGTYSTSEGSLNCSACLPGSASPYSGQTSVSTCQLCPPGTYCGEAACATCLPCDPGRFSSAEGSTTCTRCPVGLWTPGKGPTVTWRMTSALDLLSPSQVCWT